MVALAPLVYPITRDAFDVHQVLCLRQAVADTAAIQSLIVTCRLHSIDLYTYLVDVLQRISEHPNADVIGLTPRLWKDTFGKNPARSLVDVMLSTTQ